MKKIFSLIFISLVLFSCKSKKNTIIDTTIINNNINTELNNNDISKTVSTSESYLKAVKEHYKTNNSAFNTLQINADIDFSNSSLNESVSADIRIEKDKNILISLKKFGFTGAKIYITPNRVSYYEILNGTHYDGDYEFITRFLGTELSFEQVQNLLLGSALFNLSDEPLHTVIDKDVYKLYKETSNFNMVYVLDSLARLKQEVINQKNTQDKLVIDYLSYQTKDQILLPSNLLIRVIQNQETNINVNYKKIEINPNISFPYKIPNGSKAINF